MNGLEINKIFEENVYIRDREIIAKYMNVFLKNFFEKNLNYLEKKSNRDFLYFAYDKEKFIEFLEENFPNDKEKQKCKNAVHKLPFYLYDNLEDRYLTKDFEIPIGEELYEPNLTDDFDVFKEYRYKNSNNTLELNRNTLYSGMNETIRKELNYKIPQPKNILIVSKDVKNFIEDLRRNNGYNLEKVLMNQRVQLEFKDICAKISDNEIIEHLRNFLINNFYGINRFIVGESETTYFDEMTNAETIVKNPYIEAIGVDTISISKKALLNVISKPRILDYIKNESERLRRVYLNIVRKKTNIKENHLLFLIDNVQDHIYPAFVSNFKKEYLREPTKEVYINFVKNFFKEKEELEKFLNYEIKKLNMNTKQENQKTKEINLTK